MKYIKKKLIKGKEYFYFEYSFRLDNKKYTYTKYLGAELPDNLKERFGLYFQEIAGLIASKVQEEEKKYFPPRGIETIERLRFEHKKRLHELFRKEFSLFKSLFYVLFTLNSNRAEGSKITRENIEEVMIKRIKPKTTIEKEVVNSIEAINFALSKEMRWNQKSVKMIHQKLFQGIYPGMAGNYRKVDVVVGEAQTTPWREIKGEMGRLLRWFHEHRKRYPPKLALEFHWRFEAIHPFEDGNGRVGRILLNALLIEQGYAPVIFFSENHQAYCQAIEKAREGRTLNLAKHLVESLKKTKKAIGRYKEEGVIKGGSAKVGKWEIQKGRIRVG